MRETRDNGLQKAIDAVGGVGALARGLGIAQPSVSGWKRVPADRVLAIESLTGVSRFDLRPDLHPSAAQPGAEPADTAADPIEVARGQVYLLLAALLAKPPTADLLDRIGAMAGNPSPLGLVITRLSAAARATTPSAAGAEFFDLFIGVGRGELVPYASFYLTGFLNERPLARVRQDFERIGLARREGVFEPEDHVATLLETMGGLALGSIDGTAADQRHIFERHLAPWASRFFADLRVAEAAIFYRSVGELGAFWIDIETAGFELPE